MSVARAELPRTNEQITHVVADLAYAALIETGHYTPDYMSIPIARAVHVYLGNYGVKTRMELLYSRGAETPTHASLHARNFEGPKLATVTDLAAYRKQKLAEQAYKDSDPNFLSKAIDMVREAEGSSMHEVF